MSKDPRIINVGVIGAGFGAQVHTPAFLSQPGCKVTALYSNSSDKAKTLSETSELVGLTSERVRQLQQEALRRLRCKLAPHELQGLINISAA